MLAVTRSALQSAYCVENSAGARLATRRFAQHWKMLSWLYLVAIDIPTLRGVIVTEWNDAARTTVAEFTHRHGVSELLIRSDKAAETGAYPRGGFTVSQGELAERVCWFLKQRRTVFLLEPRSPYDDLYSLSLRFTKDSIDIEVVGPGFDASDLKRGDESPHERIALSKPKGATMAQVLSRAEVSPTAYKQSWDRRLRKIAKMETGNEAGPAEKHLTDIARASLRARAETLLLEHEEAYEPIPEGLLLHAVSTAAEAALRLRRFAHHRDQVFSASFISRRAELVFWDVVWPDRKYGVTRPTQHASGSAEGVRISDLSGLGASPGIYTGRACVLKDSRELDQLRVGDVLIAPTTSPKIAVHLGEIGALVTDHGGRLCHAAVVAREAGIPAVVGTFTSTQEIPHGSLVRVDGTHGTVTILSG